MIIDPKSTLFGLPTLTVRQVLRSFPFGGGVWRPLGVATDIVKDRAVAEKLVQDLVQAGYLQGDKVSRGEIFYELTVKGNRLAMASARPMRRSTATRKLQELLSRCWKVNGDPKLCYFVPRIVVFGSYVGDKDPIGDLDIAFQRKDRYSREGIFEGKGPMHEAWEQSRMRAPVGGIASLFWPETEFKKALKAGSAGLSLHDLEADRSAVLSGPHFTVFFPPQSVKCT